MGQNEILLKVQNIGKKYKRHWAVEEISFLVRPGEVLGILGENGAGKSTLLSLIATLQRPTKGEVFFCDRPISFRTRKEYRSNIGYVPQEIALFEELNGWDNLRFFGETYHLPKKIIEKRIAEVCDIVSLPQEALKKRVSEYSGGMKRKLNIGAALLHEPKLLLLDEPTANIDYRAEEQILAAVKVLSKAGTSVIYVGHQMELAEELCDTVLVLEDGKKKLYGELSELLQSGEERKTLRQLLEEC